MKNIAILTALAGLLVSAPAMAFEVTGGKIGLGYSTFTDSPADEFDRTALNSSLQFGVTREVSVQADLGFAKFGGTELDSKFATLHAIYHAGEETAFGAYFGREEIEGEGRNFYGLEIGQSFGRFAGEGYVTRASIEDFDLTVFGLRGGYAVTEQFAVGARYDQLRIESLDASRLSLQVEFAATEDFALNAEIGSIDVDYIGSEPFVGIGAQFKFGPSKGTTFQNRSVLGLIPGL